ncbi:hypothetical protein [Pseudoalteromonas luteoviolacea]|uniref:Pseudaminic acid biosynthesis protein PseG n=1 Tax=Pseudoalteromonas luteoviolacea NCIMB 1942 TaxID=1365253 RepID=A0A167GE94_9GAMM|nr:hypothetical protein [Pseudoalteromonas luteoviolacea]KZN54974.1 hypothetical protein N482_05310 [Pseudoalteromonas luteoviolacea NCIMB 1942]
MIVFRVDTRCGLGHFMRMKWLACELEKQDQKTLFLVDDCDISRTFMSPLQAELVTIPRFSDSEQDATWCKKYLSSIEDAVTWVVVDGYELDSRWESIVLELGIKLLSVDDLERPHVGDCVLDMKWLGAETESRYQRLMDPKAHRLLGPQYAILAPEYLPEAQQQNTVKRDNNITFALGGGGNWHLLEGVIEQLCSQALQIQLVFGPKATGTENLLLLSEQNENLKTLSAPASLAECYARTGLFVGALGTSLYELAATKTPSLTFSLAQNQENRIEDLEELGHYFHISDLLSLPVEKVVSLITTLYTHRAEIEALRQSPKVNVDGRGASRITDYLLNSKADFLANEIGTSSALGEVVTEISSSIKVRKIYDEDVNRYLNARNRDENMWRMTVTDKISKVDHYNWWFNNARQSYVLEQNGKALIYVWHQLRKHEGRDYLYGGWFAACDDVNFAHAQIILDWQLNYCAKLYPKGIWLAVINKDNRFVNLLNQKEGFISLIEGSKEYFLTQQIFAQADASEFNFVGKFPR